MYNYIKMSEGIKSTTLECHWQNVESWVWTKSSIWCSSLNAPTLFLNLQMWSLACRKCTTPPPPHPPNTLPTMTGGRTEQLLCVWILGIFTSTLVGVWNHHIVLISFKCCKLLGKNIVRLPLKRETLIIMMAKQSTIPNSPTVDCYFGFKSQV